MQNSSSIQQSVTNSKKREHWFTSDKIFDTVYPPAVRLLAHHHWTPLAAAREAARFLATEAGVKILDIGSGAGKFCLAGARDHPACLFYGVEQRQNLVEESQAAAKTLGIMNTEFLHANFTQVDFHHYQHFYFYNSFYENLAGTGKIDTSIDYSAGLYHYYNRYLYRQLQNCTPGTRLVTFHSLEDEIPPQYHVVGTGFDNLLKYWIRI